MSETEQDGTATVTRRDFLTKIAMSGGAGAALAALDALGQSGLAVGEVQGRSTLPAGSGASGKGKSVTIVGAGIAGMVAAYELGKMGFRCTVVEARSRAGGRNWTIRGGDRVDQLDGVQRALWPEAPHNYFNVGPARIPNHHRAILHYCRELKVPLEVMVNDNRSAYLHDEAAFGGRPVEARQVISDTRGLFSELLCKALSSGTLDAELSLDDRARLREAIIGFGDLQPSGRYAGSSRAGYAEPLGAGIALGKVRDPLPLKELLRADFWQFKTSFPEFFDQASPMLQPVGGMDRIATAFAKHLGPSIRYNLQVEQIRKTATGARVVCRDAKGGKISLESDFVVCTLPLSVLREVSTDLSAERTKAITEVQYIGAGKLAFHSRRRWWEEDLGLYGGISWTSREITQIMYPSHGIGEKDGVLVGAYAFLGPAGEAFARATPAERNRLALNSGEMIHPGYSRLVQSPLSVAWDNVPFSRGSWAEWTGDQRKTLYPLLLEPDGPIYLAGEHLSTLPAWQEGAVLSAHRVVEQIIQRVRA